MTARSVHSRARLDASRGFTLVELMVVTTIIGLLSSVAVPGYQRMMLRTRSAERSVILPAIARAAQDLITQKGQFPSTFIGVANPPGTPTTYKRTLTQGQPGWKDIDLLIEGGLYYSYSFVGSNTPIISLTVTADGDLDGDGVLSTKVIQYSVSNGAMIPMSETPPPGQEDLLTF
ncbi:MAG TPA: prepilin-type N-terminal cleavage/methylation domain-containing protein [Anaeromyxobacteraceae bacterium]|nr:prepilin-type N-terminal cleavage/methylation domain-containing protein [Anaeromyxobacteraceae bacterium]